METILICTSESSAGALLPGGLPALLEYDVSRNGRLVRRTPAPPSSGGFMALGAVPGCRGDPARAAAEIRREAAVRGLRGVAALFPPEPTAFLMKTLGFLSRAEKLSVLAPENYAAELTGVFAMAELRVTGGSFPDRMVALLRRLGDRAAVRLPVLNEDHPLPGGDGVCRRLSVREREALLSSKETQSFYSSQLFACYFTYCDAEKRPHFVLYDTVSTVRRKAAALEKGGAAFLVLDLRDGLQPGAGPV